MTSVISYPDQLWWYEMSTDRACLALMISAHTDVCLCALSLEERDVVLCVYPNDTRTVLSLMSEVVVMMHELISGNEAGFDRQTRSIERFARITHTTRADLFRMQHPAWTRGGGA